MKYSTVNLLLFISLLYKNILNGGADQCLNPSFGENQKITVEYFFASSDQPDWDKNLCIIINKSNGLIEMIHRMSSDMKNKATCLKDDNCVQNRRFACDYKYSQKAFDVCGAELPPLAEAVVDCVCTGGADDILITNQNSLKQYGINSVPAFVVEKKFDPCFKDFTLKAMTEYFCKAYNYKLPGCKK